LEFIFCLADELQLDSATFSRRCSIKSLGDLGPPANGVGKVFPGRLGWRRCSRRSHARQWSSRMCRTVNCM